MCFKTIHWQYAHVSLGIWTMNCAATNDVHSWIYIHVIETQHIKWLLVKLSLHHLTSSVCKIDNGIKMFLENISGIFSSFCTQWINNMYPQFNPKSLLQCPPQNQSPSSTWPLLPYNCFFIIIWYPFYPSVARAVVFPACSTEPFYPDISGTFLADVTTEGLTH